MLLMLWLTLLLGAGALTLVMMYGGPRKARAYEPTSQPTETKPEVEAAESSSLEAASAILTPLLSDAEPKDEEEGPSGAPLEAAQPTEDIRKPPTSDEEAGAPDSETPSAPAVEAAEATPEASTETSA